MVHCRLDSVRIVFGPPEYTSLHWEGYGPSNTVEYPLVRAVVIEELLAPPGGYLPQPRVDHHPPACRHVPQTGQ
jgi:hypothetical protein